MEVAATDPEVNAFKPHPQGFQVSARKWDLSVDEILYVGDRASVDGRGAQAAGMDVVVFSGEPEPPGEFKTVASFAELALLLDC